MGDVISNLKARFGVETTDFKKGLKDSGDSLSDLDKKVGNSISELQKMLTPVALLAGAGGALSFLKSSIEAIEGPADAFEAAIGGGKEALFEMQRALISLDFTNFLTNIAEGYERGKKFTEMLDELADKSAYSDYVVIGLQQEAEALRETSKNKTLEISVRAAAAEKIKDIELKIFNRRKELLADTFAIEKQSWEGRSKMSIEEGVKLFEDINKTTKSGYEGVTAETVNKIKDLYDQTVEAQVIGGSSMVKATKDAATLVKANLANYGNYDFIKNVPKDDLNYLVDIFSKFSLASSTGEADVWQKLFKTINTNATALNNAQQEYNSSIAETSKLLAQEEKGQVKNSEAQQKQIEEQRKQIELEKLKAEAAKESIKAADISNIKIPDFSKITSALIAPKKAITSLFIDMAASVNTAFESMAVGLGTFLGELAASKAGSGDFVKVIGTVFADLAITVGKICIAAALAKMALDKALITFGGAGVALAAGIALVAIGSAVKGSLANAASGGGSSSIGASTNSFTYDTRSGTSAQPLEIHLTGKLVGEGSTLAAVIEYESNRRKVVT